MNAPERIRTSDLRFRRPTLYPAELRAQSRKDTGRTPASSDRRPDSRPADRRRRASGSTPARPPGMPCRRRRGHPTARDRHRRVPAPARPVSTEFLDPSSPGHRVTEGEGFEPSGRGLPAQRFSRPSHSSALPPLPVTACAPVHAHATTPCADANGRSSTRPSAGDRGARRSRLPRSGEVAEWLKALAC